MTGINSSMRVGTMPENCGMKGMHDNHASHAKKTQAIEKQQNLKVEKVRDEKVGSKLDVTA